MWIQVHSENAKDPSITLKFTIYLPRKSPHKFQVHVPISDASRYCAKGLLNIPLKRSMALHSVHCKKSFAHPFMNQLISLTCLRDSKAISELCQRCCHHIHRQEWTKSYSLREGGGAGGSMVCHRGGKQAETASPGCCIIQILNWVVLPHRKNHQEDLGRKRQDPCGAYFKKIDSLITSEWSVRVDVARTLGSADRNLKSKIFSPPFMVSNVIEVPTSSLDEVTNSHVKTTHAHIIHYDSRILSLHQRVKKRRKTS